MMFHIADADCRLRRLAIPAVTELTNQSLPPALDKV